MPRSDGSSTSSAKTPAPGCNQGRGERPGLERGTGELRELVGDELRLLELTAGAPLAPGEHRLPPVQLLEAERGADDLLGVAGFRVDVLEARERRAGDGAVAEVVGGACFVEVPGGEVLGAGTTEQVGARGVDQVLLRARAGGVHHVVALAFARERRAAV